MTTFTKLNRTLTQQDYKNIVAMKNKIVIVNKSENGIEVIDTRGLIDRTMNPLKGIKNYFGETHFIIKSEKFLRKFDLVEYL